MTFGTAVVIGGSLGGLLGAAALAPHFARVIVVERDTLPEGPEQRRGVPQGTQVHALLAAGQHAMGELLPGLLDDVVAAGGRLIDAAHDMAVYGRQGWLGRAKSEDRVVCSRRPLLESVVRTRTLALSNVEVRRGTADGLVASDDGAAVAGVRLRDGTVLAADFVVDASGRGSKSPEWVAQLGSPGPEEKELRSFIRYATVPARLPEDALPPGVAGVVSHPHPGNLRGAAILPCDNGVFQLAGLGMMGAEAPTDRDGFLAHLDAASSPVVGQIARKAQFLGDVIAYRMPGSRRRLWEAVPRRLEGLVFLGDAVMSFNPLYGQGMSVAAVSALALRVATERATASNRLAGLAEEAQRAMAPTIDTVFGMVIGIDSLYEGAELDGIERPSEEQVRQGRLLSQLATEDAETSLALKRYTHWFSDERLRAASVQEKLAAWAAEARPSRFTDPTVIPGPVS